MCFGRCYPGGAALITNSKNLFDGISRLLATSVGRLPVQKPAVAHTEGKHLTENGSKPILDDDNHKDELPPDAEKAGNGNGQVTVAQAETQTQSDS